MTTDSAPCYLHFNKIGHSAEGYITIADFGDDFPFRPLRTFWTYFTPHEVVRGRHAHFRTEMILIAVNGRIDLQVETFSGETCHFVLDHPETGVYLPVLCWHTMQYSHNAVQLVFTSTQYDPEDYIRSYEDFIQLRNTK